MATMRQGTVGIGDERLVYEDSLFLFVPPCLCIATEKKKMLRSDRRGECDAVVTTTVVHLQIEGDRPLEYQ